MAPEVLRDRALTRPVLERRVAFEGRVWSVATERVELVDGTVVTRDIIEHPGAVAIIPYRDPGEVLLLRQYRHPVRRELWEPPAGLLDVAGEDPIEAARRELREEADLTADRWDVLLDFLSSPGGSSEAIRVFLARDVREVPHGERFVREAEERSLVPRWVPIGEALDGVAAGRIQSPTAVSSLLALEAARRTEWATLRPADAAWSRP